MRDVNGNNVAVFKPKDEEPFAPLNPKWPKFLQRSVGRQIFAFGT